jgi:hypothetical protein
MLGQALEMVCFDSHISFTPAEQIVKTSGFHVYELPVLHARLSFIFVFSVCVCVWGGGEVGELSADQYLLF